MPSVRVSGTIFELHDGRWIADTDTGDVAAGTFTPAGQPFEWPEMEIDEHERGEHRDSAREYCPGCQEAA